MLKLLTQLKITIGILLVYCLHTLVKLVLFPDEFLHLRLVVTQDSEDSKFPFYDQKKILYI